MSNPVSAALHYPMTPRHQLVWSLSQIVSLYFNGMQTYSCLHAFSGQHNLIISGARSWRGGRQCMGNEIKLNLQRGLIIQGLFRDNKYKKKLKRDAFCEECHLKIQTGVIIFSNEVFRICLIYYVFGSADSFREQVIRI